MKRDPSLDTLLAMNGTTYWVDDEYWIKIDVRKVKEITPERPHGLSYSLTLHNKYNDRIMGFDNAHAVKIKGKKFSAKIISWDHKHLKEKVFDYTFDSAGQLIEDFWKEVNKILP
ncbi:MAG TPA: hypothetical protein ENK06_13205 [Gammaproteobacteria bacterium]|nr:hypothetical protein [Gammaproteobacteria bacterium]